ncbi:MAG: hydrophobe/amphiphile efflux-3 (HAE3) family transporter [Dehalococcoidales bacterium]|nr:hydrophobe/amphiphile efflux-3 (HAE3) family transporter [Dehalococcoidales bacterium]MDD5498813.1 hydrophobe/amphiphile efflux-3 (HAE3) family transporter [Dehalococcoidales bacterium]
MEKIFEALARFIERHPRWFIAIALVITAAAVPGITMLETETGFSALVSDEAEISVNNTRYEAEFGGEPFTVLLKGTTGDILSPVNLEQMAKLEQFLLSDERYCCVTSPLALLEAVTGATYEQNPEVILYAAYDQQGNLNPVIAPLFPDSEHGLVQVTPAGNLNDNESLLAAQTIENFLDDNPFNKASATVISDAGLINSITISIGSNIAILLGLAVAVMIVVLLLFFRIHWRLLSLGMVGMSALWTFGLMGYLSVPMSMATMAVLPILIGLGIDFSIQFQNRYQEEITRCGSVGSAIIISISRMLPVVGVGLLATIAGFITLFVSDVPMIKDFGLMLSVGIIFSFILGLFLLHSVIYVADRRTPVEKLKTKSKQASGRVERMLTVLGRNAIRHTIWVSAIALVLAVAGGYFDSRLAINTDYEELMPQDEPALEEMRYLREITGSGGQLRFLIEASDVASPEVIEWMQEWENKALETYPQIHSVNSLATLITQSTGGIIPPAEQIKGIISSSPEIFTYGLVSDESSMASIAFNTSYISMEEVHDLIGNLKNLADTPPGISVASVGTMALGAQTIDSVIGSRMLLNLLCLVAVFIIILLSYRRLVSAILTVLPVAAVIAWSSMVMYLIDIPLNPLTAILGVLIIGIGTEFMVMINGRYREEKSLGEAPEEAMVTAITKTGRAVMATALTTLGGFAVMIVSSFVMIRDFGIVTVIGVLLCLLISLGVVPGLIVWYDNARGRREKHKKPA